MYVDHTPPEDTKLLNQISERTLQSIFSAKQNHVNEFRSSLLLAAVLSTLAFSCSVLLILVGFYQFAEEYSLTTFLCGMSFFIVLVAGFISISYAGNALFKIRPKLNNLKFAKKDDVVTLKRRLNAFEKDDTILVSLASMQRVLSSTADKNRFLTVGEVSELNTMLSRWEELLTLTKEARQLTSDVKSVAI